MHPAQVDVDSPLSTGVDPSLTYDTLKNLGDKLKPAQGWKFRVAALDKRFGHHFASWVACWSRVSPSTDPNLRKKKETPSARVRSQ
jgi:hypothetical protein